jgi:predicted esterase YcpF (UPF0227 family)
MKCLYLHGLGSNGLTNTAKTLQLLGEDVISPSYAPHDFPYSIKMLKDIINEQSPDVIVGTSMGGYFALKLGEITNLPVLAVNPCFEPKALLSKYLDTPAIDYETGDTLDITEATLEEYEPFNGFSENHLILIGLQDDIISPEYQHDFCMANHLRSQEVNWGHRVGDVEELRTILKEWYSKTKSLK